MKVASIILAAVLLAGAPAGGLAAPQLANGIKAIVDNSVITYEEVEELTAQTADVLIRQYRNQPAVLEKKMNEMRDENLSKLLEQQLILHEFKTAGYSLPESVVDELVQERIRARFGDRRTLTKTLQAEGMTYEQYRKQIRDNFIVEQLRLKNVSPDKIIISPHKMEVYYQAHRDEFKVENQVKLRVIVLKAGKEPGAPDPLELAGEILTKLKQGASFAEMATLYSQGSQRREGGDWGWWERNELTKGLADIAFGLPTNQCSGVFSRTAGDDYWIVQYEKGQPVLARHYGLDEATRKQNLVEERRCKGSSSLTNVPPVQEFYLMRVEATRSARYKPLSEVRDQVEKTLKLEERKRLEKQWIERLKKKTFVRYF